MNTTITPSEIQTAKDQRASVLRYLEARREGWIPHFALQLAAPVARPSTGRLPLSTATLVRQPATDDFSAREAQRIIASAERPLRPWPIA